jgi:hypothetical protein
MPHIITNAEYVDMLYVYSFCYGSATAAAEYLQAVSFAQNSGL